MFSNKKRLPSFLAGWIALLGLLSGGMVIHAQGTANEKNLSDLAEPVMLTIREGTCLVWSKPVYCLHPGAGYRLVVENGGADGSCRVQSWQAMLAGERLGSRNSRDVSNPDQPIVFPVRLGSRTDVRLVLRGQPGDFIRCRLEGNVLPEEKNVITLKDGTRMVVMTQAASRGSVQQARLRSVEPMRAAADLPAPQIEFAASRPAIDIGEMVTLRWQVSLAARTTLFLPDHLEVTTAGTAMLWPEQDTEYRLEVEGQVEKTTQAVKVAVTALQPELEVKFEPAFIDLGQEATLVWRSRNARLVCFAGGLTVLPASGQRRFKPNDSLYFAIEAHNGARNVTRAATLTVIDPEVRRREQAEVAERMAKMKHIEPRDDKAIRARWDGFRSAMARGDSDAAAACVFSERREIFREHSQKFSARFAERGWNALELFFAQNKETAAIYVLGPKGARGGRDFHDEDVVYFIRDERGGWWLYW